MNSHQDLSVEAAGTGMMTQCIKMCIGSLG